MQSKYFEYIIVYLSVLLACALIGIIVRQDEVALFLKLVFAEALKDVEPDTIKSHLKDEEQKGLIKIQKRLLE